VSARADVAWDPIQQLTDVPISSGFLAYNNGRSIDSHGDSIYIIFSGATNNELNLLRSFDGGATWDDPLPTNAYWATYPTLAVGQLGDIHCAAIGSGSLHLMYARSFDAGTSWESETLVTFPSHYQSVPSSADIDIDSSGNVHIMYTLTYWNSRTMVFHMRSTDYGSTWFGPDSVFPDSVNLLSAGGASLTIDNANAFHVVMGVGRQLPIQYQIRHSASIDTGQSWLPSTLISVEWPGALSLDAYDTNTLAFAYYLQSYYRIALRASTDAGATWSDTVQLSDNVGGSDYSPSLSFDRYGGTHVVWYDPGFWGVCYRYVDPNLIPCDTIARLSDLPTNFRLPHVHCDGNDRIHTAWIQMMPDTTVDAIYYRRGNITTTHRDESRDQEIARGYLNISPSVFHTVTEISMSRTASGKITICDALGKRVRMFDNDEFISTQQHKKCYWTGTDDNGHPVPAGVYFVRSVANNCPASKKVVHLK
jgi:hypothetical protein